MPRRQGFTLLEVMIAVFVFATVIGGLISLVAGNLARLGDARRELDRLERAERLVREAETNARLGVLPELGTTGATFDPPDDDLAWEQQVEVFQLPLPPELAGSEVPYSVFSPPAATPGSDESPAGLRLVRVWVYPADAERDSVDPFEAIVGSPPEGPGLEDLAGPGGESGAAPTGEPQ